MKKINSFETERPLAFGASITFVFILMMIISSIVVGANWPGETYDWYIGSAIGRLVSIFILLIVLARLGWLRSAGFTEVGPWRTWLILLLPLAYSMVVSLYTFTGNLNLDFSDPALAGLASLFLMVHAFLEEVAFRGLIMHRFIRAWGSTNRGVLKSVLVSCLFFGGMHIIYLAGEPFPVVLLRIVVACLLGILFGALVLRGRSIYPAVFFHGMLNVAGYLNLSSNATEATLSSWLLLSALMLPIAIFGAYLLRNLPQRSTQANTVVGKSFPS
jgi:membrane protease YdiL (CAAX protease family)